MNQINKTKKELQKVEETSAILEKTVAGKKVAYPLDNGGGSTAVIEYCMGALMWKPNDYVRLWP